MAVKISQELIDYITDLYKVQGKSYYEISICLYSEFGICLNPESVRYYVTRRDKPKLSNIEKLEHQGIKKVLVLSDLHIPFQREDILNIVEKHRHEISTIILGGDIVDCFAISSFDKIDALPLVSEMVETHRLLKQIQDMLPNAKKILIFGNHETRWARYMCNNPNELNKLHSTNILSEIVKGFENYDRTNGVITKYEPLDYVVVDNWWIVHDGILVCHPTTFSRVAAKTSQQALDYFIEQGIEFNVCLVAHTHKISSCFKYGKPSFEIGCLCKPQGYASNGRLTYTQQQCGYYLAVIKNGMYDINESKQYVLGGEV